MASNAEGSTDLTPDPNSIDKHIINCIEKYEAGTITDEKLWWTFKDDFAGYTEDHFEEAKRTTNGDLRAALRNGGIWVEMNSKKANLPLALKQLLDEDDMTEWSKADLLKYKKSGGKNNAKSRSLLAMIKMAEDDDPVFDEPTTPFPQPMTPQLTIPEGPPHGFQTGQPNTPLIGPFPRQPQRTTYPTSYQFQTPLEPKLVTPAELTGPSLPVHSAEITPGPTTSKDDYGRQIANMSKIYTEEMKYGSEGDNFGLKLVIFHDVSKRVALPPTAYSLALPVMLKGLALDFYYSTLIQANMTFELLCGAIQEHFEDANYKRATLAQWNKYDLGLMKSENPDKSTTHCFHLLLSKLQTLYHGLTPDLQTDTFMLNKLVLACQDAPECAIACSSPPPTLSGFISTLKTSIMTYERNHRNTSTETFMTERRYQTNGNRNDRSNFRGSSNYRHSHGPVKRFTRQKRCFVCRKENCWSTNHSEAEQQAAKDRFKNEHGNRFNNRFGKPFEKSYRQYVMEYEGNEDDALEETFKTISWEDDEDDSNTDDADTFFTTLGKISSTNAYELVANMNDQALIHSFFPDTDGSTLVECDTNDVLTTRYHNEKFFGILIDTGASTKSTVGYGQYEAYNSIKNTPISKVKEGEVKIKFGIGMTSSIGTVEITSPIGTAEFHVVDTDTPFLLCLKDMDRLVVHFNNLKNVLITPNDEIPIVRRFGHPFLVWDEAVHTFLQESPCYLTEVEIRRLHKRFGHPSVQRLQRVLERAGHDVEQGILEHLTKFCKYCQKYGKSPGRFRFTLREDTEFNYCIYVDIMYIEGKPLLHIVDEGTRYQNGKWLDNISARHTWERLQECWINTYLGPPDMIVHDAGKNFVSKEFKQYAGTMGVTTKTVPVEAHNSIGIVERYHGSVRRAYTIIHEELPDLSKDAALQMAFKAVNDTAGPDGIVPTLLVFGAYPRMTEHDAPSPTVSQRSAALRKAMIEVRKFRAQRQVNDALNHRNGPNTSSVKDLTLNSDVLVWREIPGNNKTGKWTGPFPLTATDNEDCVVELPSGPTKFRSTVIKPYYKDDSTDLEEPRIITKEHQNRQDSTKSDEISSLKSPVEQTGPGLPVQSMEQPARRKRGRPRKHPLPVPTTNMTDIEVFIGKTTEKTQFELSRQMEVDGLIGREVFEHVNAADLPPDVRLFNSRFIDEVKHEGTDKAFEKSRLVIQAYNDTEKTQVLTQSPTIQRASQRIVISMAAMLPEHGLYLRDITQAYTQSTTKLNRDFYVKPPKDVVHWQGLYLKVVRPLYGVPEAGNHWFGTYHKHHLENLQMTQSTYDPCLLAVNRIHYFGLVGLQTDDTLILGDKDFALAEEAELKKAHLMAKDREQLSIGHPIKFNGGKISLQEDGSLLLTQEAYNKTLKLVKYAAADLTNSRGTVRQNVSTEDQYVAQRARGAYLATVSQPEAAFDLSFAAQMTNPDKDAINLLNKRIQWQIDNSTRGLRFIKLNKDTLKLIVFTDSSFANNKDYTSQIGYVIVLADGNDNANILHWSSTKCRRVTRSVLASELYAMSNGYDMAASIKTTMELILDIKLPLTVCTDSKSLYDCIVKLGTTQEKRLMVDLMCLRQSYERREITEIKWIDGKSNPADAMTKSKACSALRDLIDTNKVSIKVTEWVERGDHETVTHGEKLLLGERKEKGISS